MIIVHGTISGLPDFAEIVQICVLKDGIAFIAKKLGSWYNEHYRSFELEPHPRDVSFIELGELADRYPLCDYKVGAIRMVTLKRYIHTAWPVFFFLFQEWLIKQRKWLIQQSSKLF